MNNSQHTPTASEAMHQICLSSGPVSYRQAGNGPPLLLLHGWGGSSRYWQATMAHLAGIRSIFAPDLPGFGVSPALEDRASGERLAQVVMEFADCLGLEQFDLNGHSFATSMAAYIAVQWPDRVNRLVLTCASTYRNDRELWVVQQIHRILSLWMMLRRPWMAHKPWFCRAVARRFFYRVPSDDIMLHNNMADFLRMDRRTAIESAISTADLLAHSLLRQVQSPTLVIGTRHDMIMPTRGLPIIAELIPNARLAWIERCGHLPMLERPDRYHALLTQFFATEERPICL